MNALGNHLLIELYNCDIAVISSVKKIEDTLLEAARISKAEIVESVFHEFSPHGVSGVVVIAESHFSIHTWPEYGYCALDIFTCGKKIDSISALKYLKKEFQAKSISIVEIKRGILDIETDFKFKGDA